MDHSSVNSNRWRRVATAVVIGLVLAGAATVTANIIESRNPEYVWFRQTYGPSRVSEHGEEWMVRDFFHEKRQGFFVDVGAYQYKTFSNTYSLEHDLGWSGIAIDAQEEFAADYEKFRPRTRFVSAFVSDRADRMESFFVPRWNKLVASSAKDFSDRYDASTAEHKTRTTTLNDLLGALGVATIDFVSMDIELSEPKALAGFDIDKYRPRLVCVEAHPEVRQQLLDYFTDHHYQVVGRYLRADPANLWFAPVGDPLPSGVDTGDAH
jgi:methyltransferase FkbM-like protein